ncbi:hypothetical protein TL16_g06561 [Triparma laevis f. inornata]|uniref:Plastid lipid-associated protein/fibrillin conserved domain-containing protein n=1 Tax=Triparma laevis f. inornata TaxID=1714386 RepID=A0A9W7ANB6_9STRA|nr:hypothetical protein TL16_g06561 [Triparma laevis f. inornata]
MKYALLVTLCLRGLLNAAGFSSSSIAFPQRTSLNSMNGGSYRKLVATGLLDVDPVQSGGFYKLESLASGDVKASLLDRIKSLYSDSEKIAGGKDDAVLGEIETLVSFLGSQGKGYDGDLVDGDWSLLYR